MRKFHAALILTLLGTLLFGCAPGDEAEQAALSSDMAEADQAASSPGQFSRLIGNESFTAILSGTAVGQMEVTHDDVTSVEFEFRSNGRGPTITETIEFSEDGYPETWEVSGATTFGNIISEEFQIEAGRASWTDTTGTDAADIGDTRLYVAQESGPYALWVYSRLLLAEEDRTLSVLPAGELRLEEIETLEVSGNAGTETITTYALSGIDLNPTYFALDETGSFFATMSATFALVKAGFEAEEQRLRELTVEYSALRFETIQEKVTQEFESPVRINNVRIFDPATLSLSDYSSVVIENNLITAIETVSAEILENEIIIDGAGGTLIAGLYEMHAHASQDNALLNIAAGITSVRDMGNNNAVLAELIEKIESGRLVGPRVTRSGFIEGVSPFNANGGILVASEEEAVEAVREYSNGDFIQIKIYNSINPDWVPAMIAEARANGLRVAGHVPAFTNADAMIAAGYDEMTHINQIMLGWVLEPDEDTRTLLRLTALQRLPALNIDDPAVQNTINAMAENGVSVDPTLAIHESLLLSRNGTTNPGMVDYIEHMPIGIQRGAKTAMAAISSAEEDEAYRGAYDKIIETLAEMKDQGIFIIPGTDLGGSFTYHRELELYQGIGMSPAEILRMATYDMAVYLEQDSELGSIEAGKLADLFLIPGDPTVDLKAIKTISLVVKDGTFYFPSDIYPEFGIQPFIAGPEIINAD
ncbi:amidohydrolase family protein [Haliea sp. AH-315-K21]|uniref:Amidohydrolase n=1 Tax=SAR86 cluster bacterium TaxID=2030880 RepID=A0A2A5CIR4_9GAMM|nr:amidohydrolase family protein [Haliea sp. AH-315-K21]PCJ43391.1 MAG: amidohydrolase [SAR86 cluster bacterium]